MSLLLVAGSIKYVSSHLVLELTMSIQGKDQMTQALSIVTVALAGVFFSAPLIFAVIGLITL